MVFYHGTVKAFLPSILKEGLKSCPPNRWFASWPSGDSISQDELEGTYLTPFKTSAKRYASVKAKYLAAPRGGTFRMTTDTFTKNLDAPVVKSTPVVLRIEVPASHLDQFKIDPAGWMSEAVLDPATIPPTCITVEE